MKKKVIFSIVLIIAGILIVIINKIIGNFNWHLRSDFIWLASFMITFGVFWLGIISLKDVKKEGVKIFFIIVIAVSTVKLVLDAVMPIFDELCADKAKSIATIVANDQATEVMKDHTYDELFTIEKDSEGNIIMIKSNIVKINEIISDVAVKIQNSINERGKENIKITIGSFTGSKLLSGRGPGIPIKISSIGNVETDLRSEFSAQGINQTLHRVYLQVDCEVSILTPYNTISEKVSNQVLLIENVIVGKIPNTYYNLEGINTKSDALEIVE